MRPTNKPTTQSPTTSTPSISPTIQPTYSPSSLLTVMSNGVAGAFGGGTPTPTAIFFGSGAASPDGSGLTRGALPGTNGDAWTASTSGLYMLRCGVVFSSGVAYWTRNATRTTAFSSVTASQSLAMQPVTDASTIFLDTRAVLTAGDVIRCHQSSGSNGATGVPPGVSMLLFLAEARASELATGVAAALGTASPTTTALTFGAGAASPDASGLARVVSATSGDAWTAARSGVYSFRVSISTSQYSTTTKQLTYVTRNAPSAQPSTPPYANLLAAAPQLAGNPAMGTVSWIGWLDANDTVRVHGKGFVAQTARASFYGVSAAYVATRIAQATRVSGDPATASAGSNFALTWGGAAASVDASGVVRTTDTTAGDVFTIPSTWAQSTWLVSFSAGCGGSGDCTFMITRNGAAGATPGTLNIRQGLATPTTSNGLVSVVQFAGQLDAGDQVRFACISSSAKCTLVAGTGSTGFTFVRVDGSTAPPASAQAAQVEGPDATDAGLVLSGAAVAGIVLGFLVLLVGAFAAGRVAGSRASARAASSARARDHVSVVTSTGRMESGNPMFVEVEDRVAQTFAVEASPKSPHHALRGGAADAGV